MRERLALKQAARKRQETLDEEADFNADLEWLMDGEMPTKTAKRRGNRGGTSAIDTDALARIGLFRGSNAETRYQTDMRRMVQDIQRDISALRDEAES
jgi:hypothetical protein